MHRARTVLPVVVHAPLDVLHAEEIVHPVAVPEHRAAVLARTVPLVAVPVRRAVALARIVHPVAVPVRRAVALARIVHPVAAPVREVIDPNQVPKGRHPE